jgi:hypothetical protein
MATVESIRYSSGPLFHWAAFDFDLPPASKAIVECRDVTPIFHWAAFHISALIVSALNMAS